MLKFKPVYFASLVSAVFLSILSESCTSKVHTEMKRSEVIRLVDDYMNGLQTGDFSSVLFSPDVQFLGPLMDSPIQGRTKVVEFLLSVSEEVKDIQVRQHIIDGSTACVLLRYETKKGKVLPILDYIRIGKEGISYIQPFFDPRPLIGE